MATKIRLARFGRRKRPFYRIMISDGRAPRDGRYIEQIGYYDPLTKPKKLEINREKVNQWLDFGAVPTTTVRNLLSSIGIFLERELLRQGKSEETITEELQKFELLQDLKLKIRSEKRKTKKKAQSEKVEVSVKEEVASVIVDSPVEEETALPEVAAENKTEKTTVTAEENQEEPSIETAEQQEKGAPGTDSETDDSEAAVQSDSEIPADESDTASAEVEEVSDVTVESESAGEDETGSAQEDISGGDQSIDENRSE